MKNLIIKSAVIGLASACACACGTQDGPVRAEDLAHFGLVTPVRELTVTTDDNNEADYKVYFGKGHIERIETFGKNGKVRSTEYIGYDGEGRPIEELWINAENESEGRWCYTYSDGQLATKIFYGMNTDEQERLSYAYTDTLLQQVQYYHEGDLVTTTDVEHIPGGTVETVTDASGTVLSRVTELVLESIVRKPVSIRSDNGAWAIDMKYDEHQLPVWVRNARLDSEDAMQWDADMEEHPERFYEYSFDKNGNWTERRERNAVDGDVLRTVKRKIRY